jgi:hypothetical protein
VVCLLRAKRGGGGCARSAQTEGALRLLALQVFSAPLREAFAIIEAEGQPAEARPAVLKRAA